MTLLYTVLLVGALVLVHELGHLAVARAFGVKVLTFSLGFGPRLLGVRAGETELRLSLVPIGGYVRLLGEAPEEGGGDPADAGRSLAAQAPWKRVLIVAAGPAMNLVFPLLLFFVVHLGDERMAPPVVGTVFPDRPADGKLAPGDRILSVEGDPVETFDELARRVEGAAGRPLRFEIARGEATLVETIRPVPTRSPNPFELPDEVGRIGIIPHHPLAVVGVARPDSPAGRAGLRTFDVVLSAGGVPTGSWHDLDRLLEGNRGTLVPMTALRPARVPGALGGLVELEVYEPFVAQLSPAPGPGSGTLRAGLEHADLYVAHVRAGSVEHEMGLLPGDRIVALDGRPARLWATFLADLRAGAGEHVLTWLHRGELREAPYRLPRDRGETEHGERFDRRVVGMSNWMPRGLDHTVPNPAPVRHALREAFRSTWETIELTVWAVVRLVQGELTFRSIGGPLALYEIAGVAAEEGTTDFLVAMAILSVNLGLLNLLPIPLLDGGQIVFVGLESARRRPLSRRAIRYAGAAGLTLLLLLGALALRNDVARLAAEPAPRAWVE